MAVYRPRRRRLWPWILGGVLLSGLFLAFSLRGKRAPSGKAGPEEALRQMQEVLEVLILSHYPEEGPVEEEAALADLAYLERLWEQAESLFSAEERRAIEVDLSLLRRQVESGSSPKEVWETACRLLAHLGASCP